MALSCLAGVQALAQDSLDAFGSVPAERPVVAWPSGQVTATERRLGVPTFFWASPHHASRTPRAVGLSATEAARQHLLAHVALYRGSPPQWAAAEVTHVHDTGRGAVIVAFQQRVDGVRVFRDELKVVMDRELNLVALSGYFTPELKALGEFALTATSAVATAWQLETRQLAEPRDPSRSVPDDDGYLRWEEPGRFARARPVWFALGDGLVPAYSIELESNAGSHAWVISAADGRPLFRKNLAASHSYFVWADPATKLPHPSPEGPAALPHPTGWVDGTIHGQVPQQLITLDHAGLSTGDPWLPPGAATLTGNNVRAYADLYYPDGYSPSFDLAGQASAPGVFQYTYDHARDASADHTQRQASLVHLFYVNNFLHDWLYDAGFDERAGNAQFDNFQRGGQDRDELLAEGLDWSGCCNANMMTPADGRSPRMQMYRWWYQTPSRDSGLDTTIVAHEFGHLVSNRLIGNGTGIANHQGDALGEGWSDFLAWLLLATADDTQVVNNATWGGAFPLGGYADGSPNSSYFGLRRYPVSIDFAKNPLTFTHIQRHAVLPTGAAVRLQGGWMDEVHNAGEVWAVMLWECYVALLNDPRHTFSAAQERMKRYLIAGLKATPVIPTFVEARDALLAVAAAEDPQDYLALWSALARRGIGGGALGPDRYNTANQYVTESYQVSSSIRLAGLELVESAGSCDGDGRLDADEEGELLIPVRNLGLQALGSAQATLTLSASHPGVRFPAGATLPVPTLAPSEERVLRVRVALDHLLGPQDIEFTATVAGASLFPPTTSASASWRLNVDQQLDSGAEDSFEAPTQVWTSDADPQLNTIGKFRLVELTSTQHYWSAQPAASAADVWLLSPPLHVGPGPLTITFRHRHELERDSMEAWDGAVLELSSDDGATWSDIGGFAFPGYTDTVSATNQSANPLAGRRAFTGRSERFPEFRTETVSLGSTFAGKTVRVRFRFGSDDVLRFVSRGWEVDDVRVTGLSRTPFPTLVADPNRCTNQPPLASALGSLSVDEGERVLLQGAGSDPDGDVVTLTWAQTAGPSGVLSGAVFIAPPVAEDTTVILELTPHDGRVAGAPAVLNMQVRNVNRLPVVAAPGARRIQPGEKVVLKATATDSDGDPLLFSWRQTGGPAVELTGTASPEVSFVAPAAGEVDQVIALELEVSDGKGSPPPARVELTLPGASREPDEPPSKSGCGCTGGGEGWVALAFLGGVLRRRRRPAA